MQLKIILGRDFIPNFKRYNREMPKTTDYLVLQFKNQDNNDNF